jgi:hypothetical protein
MKPYGVIGQYFGLDRHFAEKDPRRGDAQGCNNEQPKGRRLNACEAKGLVIRLAIVYSEDDLNPEQGKHNPSKESVCPFKQVVVLFPNGWPS